MTVVVVFPRRNMVTLVTFYLPYSVQSCVLYVILFATLARIHYLLGQTEPEKRGQSPVRQSWTL